MTWKPKSFATQGENAAIAACLEADIRIRFYNVPIKTRFHRSTFLIDILTLPNQSWSARLMPYVAVEIQGELHQKTWGGRPAVRQQQKDEAKRNCLIAEGYRYVEATRREVLTGVEEYRRRKNFRAPKDSVLRPGHIVLDRIMRAYDDEYWFKCPYYVEATKMRPELVEISREAGWSVESGLF